MGDKNGRIGPFKAKIMADQARTATGLFDSELHKPDETQLRQNATLTLRLKLHLNFADKSNPVAGRTQMMQGKYCARDLDGYWFPIRYWDNESRAHFRKAFEQFAKVWNERFILITPKDYDGLDLMSYDNDGHWLIRPNVLCRFRLELVSAGVDNEMNVYRLDRTATKAVQPGKPDRQLSGVGSLESPFRESDRHLVDLTAFNAQTIAHEVGHRLDQDHILGLKQRLGVTGGNATCRLNTGGGNANRCYGKESSDKDNVMGGGNSITLINAISWMERVAEHTNTAYAQWSATMIMDRRPRKIRVEQAAFTTGSAKVQF